MESVAQGNDILTAAKDAVVGTAVDTVLEKGRKAITPAAPEAAGEVVEAAGDAAQLANAAKGVTEGAGKLAGVARGVASFGSKLLPIVGAAATAASALGTLNNQAIESSRFAINATGEDDPILGARLRAQLATQRNVSAAFEGLDASKAQTIQNTLINNGVDVQSANFNEGYNFSSDMVVKYGMDAGKAAKMYAEAVQYGTMTVQDLDKTMENLAKTARNTGKSFNQMKDAYDKSVNDWRNITGDIGQAYSAASYQAQIEAQASEDGGESGIHAVGAFASAYSNDDLYAKSLRGQYVQDSWSAWERDNPNASEKQREEAWNEINAAAISRTGFDMVNSGLGETNAGRMNDVLANSTILNGHSINEWVREPALWRGDKEQIKEAIANDVEKLRYSDGINELNYEDLKSYIRKAYEVDEEKTPLDSPKDIANALYTVYKQMNAVGTIGDFEVNQNEPATFTPKYDEEGKITFGEDTNLEGVDDYAEKYGYIADAVGGPVGSMMLMNQVTSASDIDTVEEADAIINALEMSGAVSAEAVKSSLTSDIDRINFSQSVLDYYLGEFNENAASDNPTFFRFNDWAGPHMTDELRDLVDEYKNKSDSIQNVNVVLSWAPNSPQILTATVNGENKIIALNNGNGE